MHNFAKLDKVHPVVKMLVKKAANEIYTKYGFYVWVSDGLRSQIEQARLLKDGKSKVSFSMHQLGLAVDICPIINGSPTWPAIYTKGVKDVKWIAIHEEMTRVGFQSLCVKLEKQKGVGLGWDAPHHEIPVILTNNKQFTKDELRKMFDNVDVTRPFTDSAKNMINLGIETRFAVFYSTIMQFFLRYNQRV